MPATDALQPPLSASEKEVIKGYGTWTHFMLCYGLKPWEFDDIDEAHQIVKGLAENDQEEKASAATKAKK